MVSKRCRISSIHSIKKCWLLINPFRSDKGTVSSGPCKFWPWLKLVTKGKQVHTNAREWMPRILQGNTNLFMYRYLGHGHGVECWLVAIFGATASGRMVCFFHWDKSAQPPWCRSLSSRTSKQPPWAQNLFKGGSSFQWKRPTLAWS